MKRIGGRSRTRPCRFTRSLLGLAAGTLVATAVPATAGAAVTVGDTFAPTEQFGGPNILLLQSTSPSAQYSVPFTGVITSWSYRAGNTNPQLRFKVALPQTAGNFTVIGQSAAVTVPTQNALNTFATRIPVQEDSVIGAFSPEAWAATSAVAGYDIRNAAGDVLPGATTPTGGPFANAKLDLSARLEADADGDGFGDETQDCSPSNPTTQACPPPPAGDTTAPDTQITAGPKKKVRSGKATFKFTSTEVGSTFQCALDKGAFAACGSPEEVKVKKGKHTFSVRATDLAGNADPTPASQTWTVKKKRKK